MAAGDYTPVTFAGTDYAINVERSLIARLKIYESHLAAIVSPETLVILDRFAECDERDKQSADAAAFYIDLVMEEYPGADGVDSGSFALRIGGKKGLKKSDGRSYHRMLVELCDKARWCFNSPVVEWYDYQSDPASPEQVTATAASGASETMDLAVRESGGVTTVAEEDRPGYILEIPYIVRGYRAGAVR